MSSPENRSATLLAPISFKASSTSGSLNAYPSPAVTSSKQLAHLDRVLRALRSDQTTSSLAAKITGCNQRRGRLDPDDRWPRFCRHPFCAHSRKTFIAKRIQSALKLFEGHPREAFLWTTVICAGKDHLVRPPFAEDPVFWPERLTHATDAQVRAAVLSMIDEAKPKLDAALKELEPSLFLAQGSFEFDVIDFRNCGVQKARFLGDYSREHPELTLAGDVFLFHLHAVVVAKRGGSYVTASELTKVLKARFPHRHQVLVMPMSQIGHVKQNVAKLTCYPLKGFSDFHDKCVVELGRALAVVGRHKLLFRRSSGFHPRSTE
ncbi:MAG: hypothetical protein ACKVRO_07555 [Micropepsaceae bacterium]